MVSIPAIHPIAWITTELPLIRVGLVGWPTEDTIPTKWSYVNHRSGSDEGNSASQRPTSYALSHAANWQVYISAVTHKAVLFSVQNERQCAGLQCFGNYTPGSTHDTHLVVTELLRTGDQNVITWHTTSQADRCALKTVPANYTYICINFHKLYRAETCPPGRVGSIPGGGRNMCFQKWGLVSHIRSAVCDADYWLGRRSLAGRLSLTCARSTIDRWPLCG